MTRSDDAVLAVDVGGTSIKAEVVDGSGDVLLTGEVATPYGDAARNAIADLGRDLIGRAATAGSGIASAGVILPGIVDRSRGVGVMSANVGWRNLSFRAELAAAWSVPVAVDHDVTAAGLAEWQAGAGRGVDDLAFVSVGTGIAAALVSGGRLLRGGAGQAGEIGHLPVDPNGRRCGCGGRGCLETIASAASVVRRYGELSGTHVSSAADVVARLDHDDAARQTWDEAVAALATGLSAVVHLLLPVRVILGGGMSRAGEALTRPVADALSRRVCAVPVPDVVSAALGPRAGVVGAALLAAESSVTTEPSITTETVESTRTEER